LLSGAQVALSFIAPYAHFNPLWLAVPLFLTTAGAATASLIAQEQFERER